MSEYKIKPEEVRVGDTIELKKTINWDGYTETTCYVISNIKFFQNFPVCMVRVGESEFILRDYDTITLLSRPLPKHKYAVGQKVRIIGNVGNIYEIRNLSVLGRTHTPQGEPIYDLLTKLTCLAESELTPEEEPTWKPKFGDWVKYRGYRYPFRVVFEPNDLVRVYKLMSKDEALLTDAELSDLTPWEEA